VCGFLGAGVECLAVEWIAGSVFLVAAALLGWAVAHIYARRAQADLEAQLAALQADLRRLIAEGLLSAARNARGQVVRRRRRTATAIQPTGATLSAVPRYVTTNTSGMMLAEFARQQRTTRVAATG
jgi:hypothetical protein